MAAVEITKVAIPHTDAGYNLTDSADFETLVAGAGNGVKFTHEDDLIVILKNDSGSPATFTLKAVLGAAYTTYGAALTNPTIAVANSKTYIMRLDKVFRAADGFVTIECDVAGKVLVLDP
jgi:hypothetical protein